MRIRILLLLVLSSASCALAATPADPLPSWNDTAPKRAIVAFVKRVTTAGSPEFMRPAARIATFDNDGTLWAEQPAYFQLAFAIDQVKKLAPEHPEWKHQQPFAALLSGDTRGAFAAGETALTQILVATHSGMTTGEFDRNVKEWARESQHPTLRRPYVRCVYLPMLELMQYLRDNGFKTYIVSGGGVEFMRGFTEEVYGVPPEQVIGSAGRQKFEMRDGRPVLIKLPEVEFVNDREGKVLAIQRIIGRRPIAAFGNSDGDLEMLQWTALGAGARFAMLVHHDDAVREWAYDRDSRVGRLDKAMDAAKANGWTLVSMKSDWKRVFPEAATDAGH